MKLDTLPGEVRAFRVDFTKQTIDIPVFGDPGQQCLSEVSVTNKDEVRGQLKPSVTHGFLVLGIALNYVAETTHSIALRVYRPGFELVEIKSWERTQRVVWKPASDLVAQETVLDSLFPIDWLEVGSEANAHRDALLYGSTEYDRLARIASSPNQRERLADKANRLRRLARERQVTAVLYRETTKATRRFVRRWAFSSGLRFSSRAGPISTYSAAEHHNAHPRQAQCLEVRSWDGN